jgi:hypothetical protein
MGGTYQIHASERPFTLLERGVDETSWQFIPQVILSQREYESRFLIQ